MFGNIFVIFSVITACNALKDACQSPPIVFEKLMENGMNEIIKISMFTDRKMCIATLQIQRITAKVFVQSSFLHNHRSNFFPKPY